MDEMMQSFVHALKEKGVTLSQHQVDQFNLYYETLVTWNEKLNLTAITEREQVFFKHFYDSLSLAFTLDMDVQQSMADVGSGAGFPGIPLKIVYPHLKLTIIDSLNKRIRFLLQLIQLLDLKDIVCWHGRAEDAGRERHFRDKFDLVTARAVARLPVLSELCLPLVAPGGVFAAMKSNQIDLELAESEYCFRQLNAELKTTSSFHLPDQHGQRTIVLIHKKGPTPEKYPRKAGIPSKTPLLKEDNVPRGTK